MKKAKLNKFEGARRSNFIYFSFSFSLSYVFLHFLFFRKIQFFFGFKITKILTYFTVVKFSSKTNHTHFKRFSQNISQSKIQQRIQIFTKPRTMTKLTL